MEQREQKKEHGDKKQGEQTIVLAGYGTLPFSKNGVQRCQKPREAWSVFSFFFFLFSYSSEARAAVVVLYQCISVWKCAGLGSFSVIIVSEIVHFYSFKNGVNRDMTVFNEGETIFCGGLESLFFLAGSCF